MSDLVGLLTEAFEEEPRRPADSELGTGIRATAYWSFAPSLEVVVAEADRSPADGHALRAWRTRLDRRPIPLVLLIESDGRSLIVGPAGDPPPVVTLDARLVSDELAAARELDPLDVRRRLPEAWDRARGAGGTRGLRNVGLFSAHYLRVRAPQLPRWDELVEAGRAASRGRTLPARLDALGFEHEKKDEGIYVLRAAGRPAAAVLSYPPGRDLDRASAGGDLPVAGLLREMDAVGAQWGVMSTAVQALGEVLVAALVVWYVGALVLRLVAVSCFLVAAALLVEAQDGVADPLAMLTLGGLCPPLPGRVT